MEKKVKLPAIGLIVIGVLGVLFGLFGLVSGPPDVQKMIDAGVDPEQAERIAQLFSTGGKALQIVGLLVSAFIAWAGLQMMKLESWAVCVAASILVMVPCFTGCCCLLGLPIGIWSLVLLFNAEVRRAFDGQPPMTPAPPG